MNTFNDVLTPLQTKIAFVSANNPGGGEGGTVPQTGDALAIVLAIIAAIAVVCVATYTFVTRQKIASAKSAGIVDADISLMQKSRKRVTLALSILAAICLAGILWVYLPFHSALAAEGDNVTGSDTVIAHVDETTGAVTVDDGIIKNESANDLYFTSSTLKLIEDEEGESLATKELSMKITALDSTIFNGKVGEKWTEDQIKLANTLKAGQQTAIHYEISPLKVEDASYLIGKTAYYVEFEEANCYSINYDTNGADEGIAPNVTIKKESETSVTVASPAEDMQYWGFKFTGWNTQKDGKGTSYAAGAKYEENASVVLYAQWQENSPIKITYKVDDECKDKGQVKLIGSSSTSDSVFEELAPRTGTAVGAEAIVSNDADHAFVGWYLDDESLGNSKQVIPERNDHKCYESKTYVARFVDVVTAEVKAQSDDESRGEVAIEKASSDIYTGSTYTVISNEGASIITITNIVDQSVTTIIASAKDNYFFEKWVWVDSKGETHNVGSEGTISEDTKFVASFYSNDEVDITIQVGYDQTYWNTPEEQGHFTVGTSLEREYTHTIENASSTALTLEKLSAVVNTDNKYGYKFARWEMDFGDEVKTSYDAEFTPTRTATDSPWKDGMTITCYFEAPKALYTAANSTMRFVYDSEVYIGTNEQQVFVVYPDTYVDIDNINNSKMPDWCFPDGTPQVYPRNIIFEPGFKNFQDLQSTCFWFCDIYALYELPIFKAVGEEDTLAPSAFEALADHLGQCRVLQSVEGLENVYTENITDTSFMFMADYGSSLPLETLDFSSWNLKSVQDMKYMFYGNSELVNLILPEDTEGHYFGAKATDMSGMFMDCYSLREFKVKGDFGANARIMYSMFEDCSSLLTFDTKDNFGQNATNANGMFYGCYRLSEVSINGNFGKSLTIARSMFEECYNLLRININNSVFGTKLENANSMFYDCNSLTALDLTNFAISYDDDAEYMFDNCYNLMQIKVGTEFQWSFENCWVEFEKWYINDTSEQSYYCDNVPLQTPSGKSMPYTYRVQESKAVYNKIDKSFTFLTNHKAYDLSVNDIYYIPSNTGFIAGDSLSEGGYDPDLERPRELQEYRTLRTELGSLSNEFKGYKDNQLPPWYRFTGDDALRAHVTTDRISHITLGKKEFMLAYISKFECLVDAETVEFKSSFCSCDYLHSTSCWFIADSYGKQTFKNFIGLEWIPYWNLESVACMFGGLNYDLIKPYTQWASQSLSAYNGSIFDRFSAFIQEKVYMNTVPSALLYQIGNRYDTYGTSLTEIDVSHFSPLIYSSESYVNRFGDMSGLFANCVNLKTVHLPEDDDYILPDDIKALVSQKLLSNESNMDQNNVPFVTIPKNRGGFNGLFYNCSSLENLENFDAMIRHYNNLNYALMDGNFGLSFYRAFSGCRSLESIDLRDFPAMTIVRSNGGSWILQGMFENCDRLSRIYINDGYDEPSGQISIPMIWMTNFDVTALPDYSDYGIKWDNYVRTYNSDSEDIEQNGDSPDPEYPTKLQGNLTVSDFPNYSDNRGVEHYLSGMFYRDLSNIDDNSYTLDFAADPQEAGIVYYSFDTSDDPSPAEAKSYITPVSYYVEGDSLFVDGVKYDAKAADGYKFSHWEINGNMISMTTNYGMLEDVSEDTTFVAHFEKDGMTAKAVYDETTSVGPSLTFYYDDRTPEQIKAANPNVEVFEVNPATFFDGKYDASLPTWMDLVYKGKEGDLSTDDDWAAPAAAAEMVLMQADYNGKIEYIEGQPAGRTEPIETSDNTAYKILNKNGFYDFIYNDSWQIKWKISPKAIVFDKSFAQYDSLESISGWFMADDFGDQPVEKFYSHDETGYHDGDLSFKYLNTNNISDVAFAFGGITYLNSRYYGVDYTLAQELEQKKSAFDLLNGEAGFMKDDGLYGNDFNTYGNSITELNLKSFNMDNLKSLNYMFANALQLTKVIFPDPSEGHTSILSNCQSMMGVFYNCESLGMGDSDPIVNINKFDTSKVVYMDEMFFSCSGLTSLDLSSFNTENLYYDTVKGDIQSYNPHSTDVDYYIQAIQTPYRMFYDCQRLATIKLTSSYDTEWWARGNLTHLKGWTVNLGAAPEMIPNHFENGELNPWKCNNKVLGNASCVPFDSNYFYEGIRSEAEIYTGTFTLRDAIVSHKVHFIVDDTDKGGSINGKDATYYDFIETCSVHPDTEDENVLWAENSRYVATPNDAQHRFLYWTFGDGFAEEDQGNVVPNDYSMQFNKYEYENEVQFVAHFTDDLNVAKAIFTAENGKGKMKFVYDENEYIVGQDGVLAVYNINPNCNDYNLPAWYIKTGESYRQDDDHPISKFDPVIENNAPNGIDVVFDESFKNYDKLNSMSCWFMPSISNKNASSLYVGFSTVPYPTQELGGGEFVADFSNVNMDHLQNVNYMFGGYENFSDFGGTTVQKFDITMPSNCKLSNLDGMFANCVWLNELDMNNYDSNKVKSMKKMFYNCPNLVYEYETFNADLLSDVLGQFNTSNVTDMSYMFAQYTSVYAKTQHPAVDPSGITETYKISAKFPNNFDTGKVEKMDYMFAGFYNANAIEISGKLDVSNVKSLVGMFSANPWINYVKVADTSMKTPGATDVSNMFSGDTHLGYDQNGNKKTSECIIVGTNETLHLDNAIYLLSMFSGCSNIKEFDLPRARCSYDEDGSVKGAIEDACAMLYNCRSLEKVDLTNYYIKKQQITWIISQNPGSSPKPGASGGTASAIVATIHSSYGIFSNLDAAVLSAFGSSDADSPLNYKLKEIVLGDNSDTTLTYKLQWNTQISFFDMGVVYRYYQGMNLVFGFDEPVKSVPYDGMVYAWNNVDTAMSGSGRNIPWDITNANSVENIFDNPMGTWLRQDKSIIIGYDENLYFDEDQFKGNFSDNYYILGYGNGFTATYSTTDLTTETDNVNRTLSFTVASQTTNAQYTFNYKFYASGRNILFKYVPNMYSNLASETNSLEGALSGNVEELFNGIDQDQRYYIYFWNYLPLRNYKTSKLADNNTDEAIANAEAAEAQEAAPSLDEVIAAAEAGETAFEQMVSPDAPAAEVAAAALSVFSTPLPWTFFTLLLDILV